MRKLACCAAVAAAIAIAAPRVLARVESVSTSVEAPAGLSLSLSQLLRWPVLLGVLVALLLIEQVNVLLKRRGHNGLSLPGPSVVVPLVGGLIQMIKNPTGFWESQRLYNPTGLSSNYMVGKFMVFSADNKVNRFVLSNNGPKGFDMALHPNARLILGKSNIAFMHGPSHKALRNSFLPLFTQAALGRYLEMQEQKIREHLTRWVALPAATEIRTYVRDLNLETSQYVFLGNYLDDPKQFGKYYLDMTNGFMVAPIPLPGFALWDAIQSRKKVVVIIRGCVERSKAAMRAGELPSCLLDYWTVRCLQDIDEAAKAEQSPPEYTHSHNMAETMMDFLFASQDASTASLCWVLTLMSDYPEVFARVRAEQASVRPNNEPLNYDMLERMPFTRQVVLEVLRHRPPAMMVPQVAVTDVKLTEEYTAKAGSIVIPSLWASCRNGYVDGESFVPDRFAADRKDTWAAHTTSFMPFGCGNHSCVGQRYAIHHLIAFLAVLAGSCTWQRVRTAQSDGVAYLPTLYPADSIIKITQDRAL